MASLIDDFIYMSKYAGMREDLVQAGGGNSSVKLSPQEMLIKASGFQMADISQTEGYAAVNPRVIVDAFNAGGELPADAEKTLLEASRLRGPRPSIETFLHAVTGRFTLHTHPLTVNILTASQNKDWQRLFPDALFVDYASPGLPLAKEYFRAYQAVSGQDCFPLIFLKNHGLIVSGDTADEVITETEAVTQTIEQFLGLDLKAYRAATELYHALKRVTGEDKVLYLSDSGIVQEAARKLGAFDHAFAPDCVVFLGRRQLALTHGNLGAQISAHASRYGKPIVFHYGGEVYIQAPSMKKAKEIESVLAFSAAVCLNGTPLERLSEEEQEHLLHMDSEQYRQALK